MRNNIILSLCALFIFWLFSPALSQDFYMIDDRFYVTSNDIVKNGITLNSLIWAFTTLFYGNWCPVTWISHMLDVQLFGMQACYHHLTSILIHILNFLLLFCFLKKTTQKDTLSFLVSLVFAIHPLSVETVVWISSRKELLATFFSLLTLNFYLISKKETKKIYYYLAIFCYFLALASKVTAISLIIVIFLIDYLNSKKITKKVILFVILSLAMFSINFIAQRYSSALPSDTTRTFIKANFLAIEHLYQYLKIIFLPNFEYSNLYPQENSNYQHNWLAIILVPLVFLLGIIYFLRTKKFLPLLGVFWFVVAVFLYLQFFPVGKQAVAHRWIYQAQIGIYLSIFSLFFNIKNKKLLIGITLVVILALSFINRKEISYYSDFKLNVERVKKLYPNNINSDLYYFNLLKESDNKKKMQEFIFESFLSESNNPELIFDLLDDKMVIFPHEVIKKIEDMESFTIVSPEASLERAALIQKYSERVGVNKKEIVDKYINSALEQEPDYFPAIIKKGQLLLANNDYQNAYIWLSKAYQKNPYNVDVLNTLGRYYSAINDDKNAIKFFQRSLEINPFSNSRSYLAQVFIKQKKYNEACTIIESTIRSQNARDEDYLVFAQCHYNLGNKQLSLKLLDFITRRSPENKEALFNSMMIHISMGNCESAKNKSVALEKLNLDNSIKIKQILESCQVKLN